jgi:hypothetical protein
VAVFYPKKKLTHFDKELTFVIEEKVYTISPGEVPMEQHWQGTIETESTYVNIDMAYSGKVLRRLIVEDWNSESLKGRDFDLTVEINEEFIVSPVFNLEVSDDGTGEEGELHFFLERIRIPVAGGHQPPSGGGLFERVLASAGYVNPGTVRYSVQCENCLKGFTFRSCHAGISDIEYFYCEKSSQPLTVSVDDPLMDFKRPGVDSKPDEFTPMEIAAARKNIEEIEGKLIKSDVGGHFKWLAPFRCPHCSHPLIDFRNNLFRKAWEYYVCCHKGQVTREFSSDMLEDEPEEEPGEQPAKNK